jgi:hypothetical protein
MESERNPQSMASLRSRTPCSLAMEIMPFMFLKETSQSPIVTLAIINITLFLLRDPMVDSSLMIATSEETMIGPFTQPI